MVLAILAVKSGSFISRCSYIISCNTIVWIVEIEKMTRGKGSRISMGRGDERHKIKVIKGRALVGDKIYRVVQVIDYTEKTSRLVAEAPPAIAKIIIAGLYKHIR